MIMAGVDVSASRLLDLRSSEVAVEIAPILNAERQEWRRIQEQREAASQAIREAGLQGLLAASQQVSGGTNLALFPDKLGRCDKLSTPKLKLVTGSIS